MTMTETLFETKDEMWSVVLVTEYNSVVVMIMDDCSQENPSSPRVPPEVLAAFIEHGGKLGELLVDDTRSLREGIDDALYTNLGLIDRLLEAGNTDLAHRALKRMMIFMKPKP